MYGNVTVTSGERTHIKEIIREDYLKKFEESTFEVDYETYLKIPEFSAMGSIYDENNTLKKEFEGFTKGVHYIMRLVAGYHINQALKALKYDTTNDINLSSDNGSNIGSYGRIAKIWGGDKLDNSVFSEFGDGRFTPAPRLTVFPVEKTVITGKFKEIDGKIMFSSSSTNDDKKEYIVTTEIKGITSVYKFLEAETERIFFTDRTKLEYNVEVNIELYPDQEIVVKEIDQAGLGSLCSHHFLPFFLSPKENSKIVIAYKPYKYLLGISKISRIVEFCLNRPSLQEESTNLIFKEISKAAGTQDVFVGIEKMLHSCEFTRGSKKETNTTTEKAGGCFKNETLRKNILG